MKKTFVLALALPLLAFALAGCSSPSGSGDDAAVDTAVSVTSDDWTLALNECLTEAGFTVEKPQEGVQTIDGDGKNFATANKTCTAEVTEKLGERPVTDEEKDEKAAWEARNAVADDCLRKAGFEVAEPSEFGGSTGANQIPAAEIERCTTEANDKTGYGQ